MRNARRHAVLAGRASLLVIVALVVATFAPARGEPLDELLSAVVHIKTSINPDGRSVATLGRTREGAGIVTDDDGLILTLGFHMVVAACGIGMPVLIPESG
jgi:hypothetical protein